MEINWKELTKEPGYISLKQCYINDIKQKHRSKEASYHKFQWVLGRAKHYASYTGVPIAQILNGWEVGRNYWWLNYYQECNQPKLHKSTLKQMGVKGFRKSLKKGRWPSSPQAIKHRVNEFITRKNQDTSNKKRWDKLKKKYR